MGDTGVSEVGLREEVRVRWHSLRILGIEDEGSRDGRPNEKMAVKILEA
jgi:hypothetical protein